jgi:hypothetical protein
MKSISSSSSSSLPLASLPLGRSARYWLMAAGVVRRLDLKKVKNKDEIFFLSFFLYTAET